MDGLKLFKYDLRKSFLCNLGLFIAFILIFVIGSVNYSKDSNYFLKNSADKYEVIGASMEGGTEYNNRNLSFSDMLMWNLRGMEIIERDDYGNKRDYDIPYIYIGLALVFSFITANYAFRNDNPVIICHARNRKTWLLSKCLCNLILITVVYACILLFSWVVTMDNKGDSFTLNKILLYKEMSIKHCTFRDGIGNVTIYIIVIPILVSYVISLVQMMVSVLTSSIVGFLASMTIYIMSIFYPKSWMIGNGFMVQRSLFFAQNGVNPIHVLGWCAGIMILSVVIMNYAIRKKDLL